MYGVNFLLTESDQRPMFNLYETDESVKMITEYTYIVFDYSLKSPLKHRKLPLNAPKSHFIQRGLEKIVKKRRIKNYETLNSTIFEPSFVYLLGKLRFFSR